MSGSRESNAIFGALSDQFGRSITKDMSGDLVTGGLWVDDTDFSKKPHRYNLNTNGGSRLINLPLVAASTDGDPDKAKIGHTFYMANTSATTTENITLRDSAGSALSNGALEPGEVAQVTAIGSPNSWIVVKLYKNHGDENHLEGQIDELLGDALHVDTMTSPNNYTPTTSITGTQTIYTPSGSQPSPSVTTLIAHLIGLDNAIGNVLNPFEYKSPARLRTVAALPTYTQAGSGVGATLTATANGNLTVDGVSVNNGDRILVDQVGAAAGSDAGIYVATDAGTAGTPFILTRATDFDENTEVVASSLVAIEEGVTCADTLTILTTNNPITVDVDSQTWQKFANTSGTAALTIGTGLILVSGDPAYNPSGTPQTINLDAEINELNNVTVSTPAAGQFLYVSATGSPEQWVNHTLVISDADDVDTTGVLTNDALRYNGSDWVPQTVRTLSITDATVGSGVLTIQKILPTPVGPAVPYNPFGSDDITLSIAWESPMGGLSNVTVSAPASSANHILYVSTAGATEQWSNKIPNTATVTNGTGISVTPAGFAGTYSPTASVSGTWTIALNANIGDLNDVDTTGSVANDIIVYNGASWEDQTPNNLAPLSTGGIYFSASNYSPTTGDVTIATSLQNAYDGTTVAPSVGKNTIALTAGLGALTVRQGTIAANNTVFTVQNTAGTIDFLDVGTNAWTLGRGNIAGSSTNSFVLGVNSNASGSTLNATNAMLLSPSDPAIAVTYPSTAEIGNDVIIKNAENGELLLSELEAAGPNYNRGNKYTKALGTGAQVSTTGSAGATSLGTFTVPNNCGAYIKIIITGVCTTAGGNATVGQVWGIEATIQAYNNGTDTVVPNNSVSIVDSNFPAGLSLGNDAFTADDGVGSDDLTFNIRTNSPSSSADLTTGTDAVINWTAYAEAAFSHT